MAHPNQFTAQSPWSAEAVEDLKRYWHQGLSAKQIAVRMGCGITRNSVIGKVTRLGLAPRRHRMVVSVAKTVRRKSQARTAAKLKTVVGNVFAPVEPLPPPVDGDIGRVSFADIGPGMCRFIPGDPRDATPFCGCETVPGTSWCEHHYRRVFQAPQPVKRTPYVDKSPAYLKATNTKLVVV